MTRHPAPDTAFQRILYGYSLTYHGWLFLSLDRLFSQIAACNARKTC